MRPRTQSAQQSRIQRLFSLSLNSADHSALLREVRGASFFAHSHVSSISQPSTSAALVWHSLRSAATAMAAQSESFESCVVMGQIFWRAQPVTQPLNEPIFSIEGAMEQTEFFFPYTLKQSQWVEPSVVRAWGTWRDAVLWCWSNRVHGSGNDDGDQAAFRLFCARTYKIRVHAPHVSRWFNPKTKAPMDMPPDLVAAFESFTGWRGLTQRFNRTAQTTCLEEVQARMAA